MTQPIPASSFVSSDHIMRHYQELPLLRFQKMSNGGQVIAILGGAHVGGSFKDLLGLGIMTLAKEKGILCEGQPVIESTSGSMGIGLATAGRLLGHPVTLVSDPNLPEWTAIRIRELGANLVTVPKPHPLLGFQEAREQRVREMLAENRNLYWFDQNNSPLNPETHTRFLVPPLANKIDPADYKAAAFCVGSGGHLSALAGWMTTKNPDIKIFAIDRPGSITFGGPSGPSNMRGVGNSNIVPEVIKSHLHLIDGVEVIDEGDAFRACRDLAKAGGLFFGGSSGAAFVAATRIAQRCAGPVLTLFADRGEPYARTIYDDGWMREKGHLTSTKPTQSAVLTHG